MVQPEDDPHGSKHILVTLAYTLIVVVTENKNCSSTINLMFFTHNWMTYFSPSRMFLAILTENTLSLVHGRVHFSAHWLNEDTDRSQLWWGNICWRIPNTWLPSSDIPQKPHSAHTQTTNTDTSRDANLSFLTPVYVTHGHYRYT